MLPLLLLLVLSSASPQDQPPDDSGRRGNVSSLNLDPAKDAAKIEANVSVSTVQRNLACSALKHKRPVNVMLPEVGDTGKLQWVPWEGPIPYGAVSIDNSYAGRTDFVCKVDCKSGFYSPNKDSYCHYANKVDGKEHLSSSFQILVNEDNFENLEWKDDSRGSFPQNSVSTCSSEEIYVGKKKYGLGMVEPHDRCIYYPWEGTEYWSWYYKVLTRKTAAKDLISAVRYHADKTKFLKTPPITLQSSTTVNHELSPVTKTVSLTKTTTHERRWDTNSSVIFCLKTTVKAEIPSIVRENIELSARTTHMFSGVNTWIEEVSYSVTTKLTVPPNHSCTVKMVGYQYSMEIPFTARLKRTYEDGETRSVNISGTYHGVQVGDVQVEVERCQPCQMGFLTKDPEG